MNLRTSTKVNTSKGRHHHTLSCMRLFGLLLYGSSLINAEFIGCYEKDERSLQRLNRVHEIRVENCVEACIEEDKVYAALETQICYCTNVKDESKTVENARCYPCSLNSDETCGGFQVVAIYSTGIKGKNYVNCKSTIVRRNQLETS